MVISSYQNPMQSLNCNASLGLAKRPLADEPRTSAVPGGPAAGTSQPILAPHPCGPLFSFPQDLAALSQQESHHDGPAPS